LRGFEEKMKQLIDILIDASMLLMFCVVWVFQMDRYKDGAGPLELLQAICVCHDGA
jgi:hypothetical protein